MRERRSWATWTGTGKVDFADFFLFADNFGKTGPPDTVRVDTVYLNAPRATLPPIPPVSEQTGLEIVPGSLNFDAVNSFVWGEIVNKSSQTALTVTSAGSSPRRNCL